MFPDFTPDPNIKQDIHYLTNNNKRMITWKRQIVASYDVYKVSVEETIKPEALNTIYVCKETRLIEAVKRPGQGLEKGSFGRFNWDDYSYVETVDNPFPELVLY